MLGIVNAESIAEVKEGLARTVIAVVAVLVDMCVGVAVEDGDGHVVDEGSSSTRTSFTNQFYGNLTKQAGQFCQKLFEKLSTESLTDLDL